ESPEELKARIRELERQLKKASLRPTDATSLHVHDFQMAMSIDNTNRLSEAYVVDGVEFRVRVEQRVKYRENDNSLCKFLACCSLYVKNLDSSVRKFVMTTMEVKEKERYTHPDAPKFVKLCAPKSEQFVLSGDPTNDETVGFRKLFTKKAPNDSIYRVQIAVVVQKISLVDIEDDWSTVVVVKNKEFGVSAQYLSMWSLYFRAYFRADMREKQEGRYPIKDDDISPEDFEELLLVIHPTDKPITALNYMKLLKMASRFEMPELNRRIELFLIDFERNELNRATIFRVASDLYNLKLVQSSLLQRWRDPRLLQNELLMTGEYKKLSEGTKALVNERLASACIGSPNALGSTSRGESRGGFGSRSRDHDYDDYYERDDEWYEAEREAMYAQAEADEENRPEVSDNDWG
ncbi:hypothetical protein PMAYCL1PPCAC_28273, partial [Pristionchus mayeri]